MPLHRNDFVLYNGLDFESDSEPVEGLSPREIAAFKTIVEWTRAFLCQPHSDLGREGPVCPFAQPSLNQSHYWLASYQGERIDLKRAPKTIELYRDWFLEIEPTSGPQSILKTIVIVFPDLSHEDARLQIEILHNRLKPDFVRRGIMLGQFYQGCLETSVWNDHFYVLESPLPLLVLRSMVPSDFPFLHGDRGNGKMLIAYLNRFGNHIPIDVKRLLVEALETSDLTLRGGGSK
ncbi:MAG: DUF6875 domain-containing protein [Bryobacteraceae bacterium]